MKIKNVALAYIFDEKEINVSENRWCVRYKEKMICDGLERKNEHDGE